VFAASTTVLQSLASDRADAANSNSPQNLCLDQLHRQCHTQGMNFNTTNSTFRQLLGNGSTYRVPAFQRDYSWADDEWDDLWQDIVGLSEESGETSHYMGYLVLQSSDTRQFAIIDGQQRLTAISMFSSGSSRALVPLDPPESRLGPFGYFF
jgi:hypothetical protein